jgi:hypothetical protein
MTVSLPNDACNHTWDFFFFFVVLGFELRSQVLPLVSLHSPFLWWVFFKIRSQELFAQAGLEPPYLCLLRS